MTSNNESVPAVAVQHCSPVAESLCGDQGTIVMAAAYLDAHYQLEPGACNQQVAVPWVWLARFAAELTYQSASNALCLSKGREYAVPSKHHFGGLHSTWCELMQPGNTGAARTSIASRCRGVRGYWQSIDNEDPRGLMLRYPMGHPDGDVPPIPAGFVGHCTWPLQLRQLISRICDLTIEELPDSSEGCRNALRYLRCAAAAGDCLGGYEPDDFTSELGDMTALLNRSVDHFGSPTEWCEKLDNNGKFVCNVPVPPEYFPESFISDPAAVAVSEE